MLVRWTQISQASGSAGGLTAAKNLGGNYLRKRVKPLNPRSDDQERARSQLAAASQAWDGLTASQRTAWNDAAKTKTIPNRLGEDSKLSGQQWFCRINCFQLLVGRTIINSPPSLSSPGMTFDWDTLLLQVSGEELSVDVGAPSLWAGSANGRLAIFIGPGQSPGVTSPAGGLTLWSVLAGNATPVTSVDVVGNSPHAIITGKAYFVRFRSSDANGNVSLDTVQRVIAG